jgi:hypothetical protein
MKDRRTRTAPAVREYEELVAFFANYLDKPPGFPNFASRMAKFML